MIILLKYIFAASLVSYIYYKGYIDLSLVNQIISHKLILFTSLVILIFNNILLSFRWKFLLNLKASTKLSNIKIIKVTWIGLFFNSVLPGSVTGDLIKVFYSTVLDKKFSKKFIIASTLVDRAIGLVGILLLIGLFTIIDSSLALHSSLIYFNIILFICSILFFITIFLPIIIQKKIITLLTKTPFIGEFLVNACNEIWYFGKKPLLVIKCLLMSMATQALNVFVFWILCQPFIDVAFPLSQAFILVPIGLIVLSIPITPGGIGVGHMVFEFLFLKFGITGGASLFNIYFLVVMFVNLLGIIPYLLERADLKLKIINNNPSILVDDDPLVRMIWEHAAKEKKIKFKTYQSSKEFLRDIKDINLSSKVYIDSNLGNDEKGEELAQHLHSKNFTSLYITTGYEPEEFNSLTFLKGILGKTPPW